MVKQGYAYLIREARHHTVDCGKDPDEDEDGLCEGAQSDGGLNQNFLSILTCEGICTQRTVRTACTYTVHFLLRVIKDVF